MNICVFTENNKWQRLQCNGNEVICFYKKLHTFLACLWSKWYGKMNNFAAIEVPRLSNCLEVVLIHLYCISQKATRIFLWVSLYRMWATQVWWHTGNSHHNIVAYLLKARTVKPAQTAFTNGRLHKQACFHGNNWIQQYWEAGFSVSSTAVVIWKQIYNVIEGLDILYRLARALVT
jgi:hypothetical protein